MLVVVVFVLPHWSFSILCFSTSYLALPRAIFRITLAGIYQFCTFSLAHRRVICNTFMLTFLSILLYCECYGFDLAFYRQPFFTLHSSPIFEALVTDESRNIPSRMFVYVCFHSDACLSLSACLMF